MQIKGKGKDADSCYVSYWEAHLRSTEVWVFIVLAAQCIPTYLSANGMNQAVFCPGLLFTRLQHGANLLSALLQF